MTRTRTRRNLTPDAVPIVTPHALYEVAAIPNVDKAFYVWAVSATVLEEVLAERAIKCNLPIVPRSYREIRRNEFFPERP